MMFLLLFFCVVCVLYACATKRVKSCGLKFDRFKLETLLHKQKGDGVGKRTKKRSGALKNINSRQESFHLSLFNIARARMFLKIKFTTVCKLCLSHTLEGVFLSTNIHSRSLYTSPFTTSVIIVIIIKTDKSLLFLFLVTSRARRRGLLGIDRLCIKRREGYLRTRNSPRSLLHRRCRCVLVLRPRTLRFVR